MHVPVFNPKSWALIYMPSASALHPHSPEDLFGFVGGQNTPKSHTFWRLLTSEGVVRDFTFNDRPSLVIATGCLLEAEELNRAGTIFSIHTKALLQRLANWNALRMRSSSYLEPPAPRDVLDIVELFNQPAVLSLDQRKSFSWQDVVKWLGWEFEMSTIPDPMEKEQQVLTDLCNLWTP